MAQLAQEIYGKTLRRDAWWRERLVVVVYTLGLIAYATWAAVVNQNYYADPYLSPLYAPCLAASCEHVTFRLVGSWWTITPALLILWAPIGFRVTCYYFRRSYYRSFFGAPPACAVRDDLRKYQGERRFPLVLQNLHRYFFYLAVGFLFFFWWDVYEAFRFEDGWGMGLGTLVLMTDAAAITLYVASCHSCRHLVGGNVDAFSRARLRYRLWDWVSALNAKHGPIFWFSLTMIVVADLYVRLVATGVITDPRFF